MSSRKQTVSLARAKFNELDNWLGIMDLDPPRSPQEKQAMYQRLMEILEEMFKPKRAVAKLVPTSSAHRDYLQREMRKLIER
jgi:hypothetical protein